MATRHKQQSFPFYAELEDTENTGAITNSDNSIGPDDRAFHDWYRFVLSFPPHLVRDYIRDFDLEEGATILDPFCGTGTTLVEAKLNSIKSIGIEANPFPCFASSVKTDWSVKPAELHNVADRVTQATYQALAAQGIDDKSLICNPQAELQTLEPDANRALIKNSISPLPLHKILVLLEHLNQHKESAAHKYGVLALGNALVTSIGNLKFGPEVGIGKIKHDTPVVSVWRHEIQRILEDLEKIQDRTFPLARVLHADARNLANIISPNSIDAVITSPPYPNEKDYTRTTRLESVILGFFTDMMQLRTHKKRLLRSNTRGVYKLDDDDKWIQDNQRIQELARAIEARRIELGKTSGFERMYARVTKLYFGGMARHLTELTTVLKPGAQLAYVVGDQASYLRILIHTGEILGEIAEQIGYKLERIDLFRTRFATATQAELREEVVVLQWPGNKNSPDLHS